MSEGLLRERKTEQELKQESIMTIIAQIKAGKDQKFTIDRLIDTGLDPHIAHSMTEQLYQVAASEKPNILNYVISIIVGLITAIGSGYVWGELTIATGVHIGLAAVGIGWLVGYVMLKASQGKRNVALAYIAAFMSVLGVLAGKYYTFYFEIQRYIQEQGLNSSEFPSLFSLEMIKIFRDNITQIFGVFDLLWFGLAAYTAFKKLKSIFS